MIRYQNNREIFIHELTGDDHFMKVFPDFIYRIKPEERIDNQVMPGFNYHADSLKKMINKIKKIAWITVISAAMEFRVLTLVTLINV